MLDFMFNGNEWNHARSISGLTADGGDTLEQTSVLLPGAFNVHVNNVNKKFIASDSSFDTTKRLLTHMKVTNLNHLQMQI